MLSKPNVKEIMPKVGNRYESALAIAKRARYIENRRIVEGSSDIRDAVDVAANEIADGEVLVKKDGEYVDKEVVKKDSVLKDEITDIVEE
ncbi:unknown [Clostridium sp. CAG:921]|nr:unknown [Clostridium sp. CAG:921]